MKTIYNSSTNPHFNLAAEEYLLRTAKEDIFMLWRNGKSVIIGKNQNTFAEINSDFIRENNITVARRITGGGAVFHDLGNVNFSFITKADDNATLNFKKFLLPIISALKNMGINAEIDGRNDIVAEGFKISGNAQCVYNRDDGEAMLLHHGTLLFSADMSSLAGALNVSRKKMEAKGIKSIASRVKNIVDFESYKGTSDVEDFIAELFSKISNEEPVVFTESEIAEIKKLEETKFSTWDFIYGMSPKFETVKEERFNFGTVSATLECKKGIIENVKIYGDFFGTEDIEKLEDILVGLKYDFDYLTDCIKDKKELISRCISGATPDDIVRLLTLEETSKVR